MIRTIPTVVVFSALCAVTVVAQQPTRVTTAKPGTRVLLPGTRGSVYTTIQGNALNSTNGPLADATVRLRDVRYGRIIDTTTTDKTGLFTFRGVDPGNYIVELMGKDQTVLAASQILNIDGGEAVTAVVKLPFRIAPLAGLFGNSTPSALAVMSAAAAAGVLATTVTGEPASARR